MEFSSYPDLSPEHSYAQENAAKELVKYCLEFDRWRIRAERRGAGLAQDPRKRGMLVTHLAVWPTPPERRSID
jgi:hypothetical protein